MNYQEHYDRLVSRARNRKLDCYSESHHIMPKCMGGTDDKNNLVQLTAREHFIAHLLLLKIYPKSYGLIKAVNMMCMSSGKQERSMNRMYGWLREKLSSEISMSQKGEKNSNYGNKWVTNLENNESYLVKGETDLNYPLVLGRNIKLNKCKICGKLTKNLKFCSYTCSNLKNTLKIKVEKVKAKKVNVEKDYSIEKNETILLLKEFISSEFKTLNSFIKGVDIPFSLVTFTKRLKKHIPEYQHITQGCRDVKSILSKYCGPIA